MGLLAASMLAIDVGMLMTARNQAQNSADAGALAGATALVYDDWDDRSASGPAVVNALAASRANKVMRGDVVVGPENVEFLNDEMGTPNRVRVTVQRTVNTLVAQYFGIATANINAVATAEASNGNAMTCVKPFTIPDRWIEKNPNTIPWTTDAGFSRYDKKGNVLSPADVYEPAYLEPPPYQKTKNPNYSGYNMEANRGMKLVLRAGQGNNIQPSMYFSLAMTSDTGGQDYRWNIANCNHSIYHWGDQLIQEPGAMEGPTIQGIEELIARDPNAHWVDDPTGGHVADSSYGDRQSPRVFPIPLYDPAKYAEGKANGRVAEFEIANFLGFFAMPPDGNSIPGRITQITGIVDKDAGPAPVNSFPKAIRLVQ
jgi:hypothetical protein